MALALAAMDVAGAAGEGVAGPALRACSPRGEGRGRGRSLGDPSRRPSGAVQGPVADPGASPPAAAPPPRRAGSRPPAGRTARRDAASVEGRRGACDGVALGQRAELAGGRVNPSSARYARGARVGAHVPRARARRAAGCRSRRRSRGRRYASVSRDSAAARSPRSRRRPSRISGSTSQWANSHSGSLRAGARG